MLRPENQPKPTAERLAQARFTTSGQIAMLRVIALDEALPW